MAYPYPFIKFLSFLKRNSGYLPSLPPPFDTSQQIREYILGVVWHNSFIRFVKGHKSTEQIVNEIFLGIHSVTLVPINAHSYSLKQTPMPASMSTLHDVVHAINFMNAQSIALSLWVSQKIEDGMRKPDFVLFQELPRFLGEGLRRLNGIMAQLRMAFEAEDAQGLRQEIIVALFYLLHEDPHFFFVFPESLRIYDQPSNILTRSLEHHSNSVKRRAQYVPSDMTTGEITMSDAELGRCIFEIIKFYEPYLLEPFPDQTKVKVLGRTPTEVEFSIYNPARHIQPKIHHMGTGMMMRRHCYDLYRVLQGTCFGPFFRKPEASVLSTSERLDAYIRAQNDAVGLCIEILRDNCEAFMRASARARYPGSLISHYVDITRSSVGWSPATSDWILRQDFSRARRNSFYSVRIMVPQALLESIDADLASIISAAGKGCIVTTPHQVRRALTSTGEGIFDSYHNMRLLLTQGT